MYLNLKFSPLPTFHWFFIDLNVNVAVNHNVINYSNWINWKALRGYTVRMLLTVWTLEMISGLFRPADRPFGRHWGGEVSGVGFQVSGRHCDGKFCVFFAAYRPDFINFLPGAHCCTSACLSLDWKDVKFKDFKSHSSSFCLHLTAGVVKFEFPSDLQVEFHVFIYHWIALKVLYRSSFKSKLIRVTVKSQ